MDELRVIWEQRQWRRPGREQQHSGTRRIPRNNSGIYDPDSSPCNPGTGYANPGSGDSSSHASTADSTARRTIERIAAQSYAYADTPSEADANADPKTETHANTKTNSEAHPETDTKGDRKTDCNAQTVP